MENAQLPPYASVVVIGGGVMGCSTLYHLAKEKVSDTVLLERNQLTSGTTWHSAAQVRALRSTRNLTDLIRYSIQLYAQLEEETGQATGWINKGSLSIATNEDRLIHIKRQAALAHLFGVRAQAISGKEAQERWPLMNAEDVIGAVWSPEDGRVGPSDLCAALVKGARRRGAKIFEETAVIGVLTHNNKVVGLETTEGSLRCDAIALCTGLWSRKGGAMGGVSVPVWPCEHFYLLTQAMPEIEGNLPTLSDHDSHLYIRDESGGLLVGCFEPVGKPIDPDQLGEDFAFRLLAEDWEHFEPMSLNALHRLPALETVAVKRLLNGPEGFTPDGAFLLGESAETSGFFLGCGMNSVGVAAGGGAGMALAHAIVHGHTPSDLFETDPKRFPDCFASVEALSARVPEILGTHYEITFPGRQHATARGLRLTPLHQKWVHHQAQFAQVFGWERPAYFNSPSPPKLTFGLPAWFEQVGQEVEQAHKHAALFDQSTFGKIEVAGADAETFLNRVCANNMARSPGHAIYTAMLNERGGFESDFTAIRLANEHYRLFVGTGFIKRDLAWLKRHKNENERVRLDDITEEFAVLALMGAETPQIAQAIQAPELNALGYFRSAKIEIANIPVQATRLSYVGEAGWELMCPTKAVGRLYEVLADAGARPAGLYAQTSMRIEKRFLAMGHDLDADLTPLQAGLEFALHWQSDFIGKAALLARQAKGIQSSVVLIVFHDSHAVPLGNEPVLREGKFIGQTTSAAFGYRIKKPVAIAHLKHKETLTLAGLEVSVNIAGELFHGIVSLNPAFDPQGQVMRSAAGF